MIKIQKIIIAVLSLGTIFSLFLLYKSSPNSAVIPIFFDDANTPIMSAKLNGNACFLKFDTGSKHQMLLHTSLLDSLEKKEVGEKIIMDAKGNKYDTPYYQLSSFQLESLKFKNVLAYEETDLAIKNKTAWEQEGLKSTNIISGRIGRPILEKWNFLLDFPHNKMIATNSKRVLKEEGFNLAEWIQIRYTLDNIGIILNIDTDLGLLRLLLDTGTTCTFIKRELADPKNLQKDYRDLNFSVSSKFIILDHDFGSRNLYLYDFGKNLTAIDGILGMDFIENHQMYLDYKNSILYLNSKYFPLD